MSTWLDSGDFTTGALTAEAKTQKLWFGDRGKSRLSRLKFLLSMLQDQQTRYLSSIQLSRISLNVISD